MKTLPKSRTGWIGVDIGTSTVKVAQVSRNKRGWNLTASAVISRQQSWETDISSVSEVISSLNEIQAARSLQIGYRGRRVVATLPMALCDVHRLDHTLDQKSNLRRVLRQTIETATQRSAADVQYDYWTASANNDKPGWTQILTIGQDWTNQLCDDIARAGWTCEKIDGLPLTIARAVNMVHPISSEEPVAALDWGHGRATLCLIEQGQPTYVRCLKGCGLNGVVSTLADHLQVSRPEAQKLIEKYGLSHLGKQKSNDVAQLVQEVLAEPMARLVEEIKRSCSHFQYLRRSKAPRRLYLLGGGATIDQLDSCLSSELSIHAGVWQLSATEDKHETALQSADCLLAPAIALSAVAWEAI